MRRLRGQQQVDVFCSIGMFELAVAGWWILLVFLLFIAIPTSFFKFKIFAYILFVLLFIEYYGQQLQPSQVWVWIMVILRGQTLFCARCYSKRYPLHAKRVWPCNLLQHQQKLTNLFLYCFITLEASVTLVKVVILSCVSWPICLSYKRHYASVYYIVYIVWLISSFC